MIAARSPEGTAAHPAQALTWPCMAPGRLCPPAQGSTHRALPLQERVSSCKVGPAGRQRLAGLAAPVFALSARPSFSLAIRASSEQASRNGSVVSRAVRPSALIYRKSLALFL